ncbi:MAG: DegT/DnrJ/EryC1/StrS family aminotransferase, partial [Deltaproteobacteria bacterium]
GFHFPAGHLLSHIRKRYRIRKGQLKETERAADKIVSLPLFPDMEDDDVYYVCQAIKEILKHE